MSGSATGRTLRRRPVARLGRRCDEPTTTCPDETAYLTDQRQPKVNAPGRPRVGLLGGSFNPAHGGHRAISLEALKRLGLDQVWWLVSPQNPLKSRADMADLPVRMASAAKIVADHPRILVTDLERRLGTRFTVDTVKRLKRKGKYDFVWLIGADNLLQLPEWRDWKHLLNLVPIAVFDREPYSYRALAGQVARRYAPCRLDPGRALDLVGTDPPAWVYFRLRRHPISSTEIRSQQDWPTGKGAGSTAMQSGTTEGTSS